MTNRPLTLGIIGAANIARQFTEAARAPGAVNIVAVASRGENTARAFAQSCGIPKHFGSYQSLLDDDSIEAVYIPLPNHLHAEWSIKAAQRGKHVLCEKPLCLGRDEAEAIFAAARANSVIVLEGYPYRYQPQTIELLKLLADGAIGTVRTMQASFGFTVPNPDVNIRMKPEVGGGALL